MKDAEGDAGARRCRFEVYFCLFLAWGLGQILHLMTLTFPFCQMGKQLQPLQGLVPGMTGAAKSTVFVGSAAGGPYACPGPTVLGASKDPGLSLQSQTQLSPACAVREALQ